MDLAKESAEQDGIVVIDEIDKLASSSGTRESGVRGLKGEGVQKELLALVEGSSTQTRHGPIDTHHVLFIGAGAFTLSKPADLLPELQGRLPIRVALHPLTESDFVKILSDTEFSLVDQLIAMMKTEGVDLEITEHAIREIARCAAATNAHVENI